MGLLVRTSRTDCRWLGGNRQVGILEFVALRPELSTALRQRHSLWRLYVAILVACRRGTLLSGLVARHDADAALPGPRYRMVYAASRSGCLCLALYRFH